MSHFSSKGDLMNKYIEQILDKYSISAISINFKSPQEADLRALRNFIKNEENSLINRTLYFLLSGEVYNEDNMKQIDIDLKISAEEEKEFKNYQFLKEVFQTKSKTTIKLTGKLSKKEKALYELLKENTYQRHQLIELIYGSDSDFLKAETSFKSLLYRFKKKIDGEIFISPEGIYSIS